jgi:catechol 2,3-dioxygenase-like lactoylglutathione lyase family enzyme
VIEDVDHVGVVVADLVAGRRFVTEVLGFVACDSVELPGRLRAEFFTKGACELELIEVSEPRERAARLPEGAQATLDHVALRATDVAGAVAELERGGVAFEGQGVRAIGGRDVAFTMAATSAGVRFQVVAPRQSDDGACAGPGTVPSDSTTST